MSSSVTTIEVQLAATLSEYCGGVTSLQLSATTVGEALSELERIAPAVYRSVCDDAGAVRRHVNLFINTEFVPAREPTGLGMAIKPGDVLTIWPAVSGG